jgi:hypothetical protein
LTLPYRRDVLLILPMRNQQNVRNYPDLPYKTDMMTLQTGLT